MGDGDYLAAFSHILMPVAREASARMAFLFSLIVPLVFS